MPQEGPDWTIGMDDLLTERWGGCTVCQKWPLWTVHTREVHGLVVGASLCFDCFKGDKDLVRLDAYLHALYDPGRFTTNSTPKKEAEQRINIITLKKNQGSKQAAYQ